MSHFIVRDAKRARLQSPGSGSSQSSGSGSSSQSSGSGSGSSQSPGSVSSQEIKLDYFVGEGEKDWNPERKLVVNKYNITRAFKKFRESSVTEAEEGEDLDCLKVLSLSHIFPANRFDRQRCITKYLNEDAIKALKTLKKQVQPTFVRAPPEAVIYCNQKMNEAEENDEEEEEKEDEENEENEEYMMKMVKDLVNERFRSKCRILEGSDISFTVKYVLPSIKRVLLEKLSDKHCYAVFDKAIYNGKKPSFLLGTTSYNNKDVFFFFVEAKRPEAPPSEHQIESSYTKLMKMMKGSVDAQLSLGIQFPVSLGLLVEGFECTLFQMMQVADGIYMPSAIKRFALVAEDHQLVFLPSVVEALYFVKLEFGNFVDQVSTRMSNELRVLGRNRVLPSFDTKKRNQQQEE